MNCLPRLSGFALHGDSPLPDRTDYLVGDFLPMKGVGLLVGEPTVGKTFLTLGLGASIASGSWFLGQYLPASAQRGAIPRRIEGGATLFVAGEGLDTYPARAEAAFRGLGDGFRDRLAEIGCGASLPVYWRYEHGLRDDGIFARLLREVKRLADDLIPVPENPDSGGR